MSIEITAKGNSAALTLLRIIKGELKNWGYDSDEVTPGCDEWGDSVYKLRVEQQT